ncbi:MAG: type II secretion system protein GspG [Planctomycetota bacterium]
MDLNFSDDVGQRFGDAQLGVASADIARLAQEVDSYIIGNGKPPASLENVTEGGEAPLDPWSHPYAYRVKGSFEYVIWSYGPNGTNEKGKGDDVTRPN